MSAPSTLLKFDLNQDINRDIGSALCWDRYFDISSLSPFQRVLLTTNGTITHIVEAYANEEVKLRKLYEERLDIKENAVPEEFSGCQDLVERKILLQGDRSGRNYIYAESILALDNLEESIRRQLITTKTPIGKVWVEQKVEIFKENIHMGREPVGDLSGYFDVAPDRCLLVRTYYVYSNRKCTMRIIEKFPECYFRGNA